MNVAIVLAAGASTRLGRPKALIEFHGQTLLERAIETASSACDRVIVVTGADDGVDQHARAIANEPRVDDSPAGLNYRSDNLPASRRLAAQVVRNARWQLGMGTSIAAGMDLIGDAERALIVVVDQPKVSTSDLAALCNAVSAEQSVAAAAYDGTVGVPACFHRSRFEELRSLPPERGAKALLRDAVHIEIPSAWFDVDVPEDLEKLNPKP